MDKNCTPGCDGMYIWFGNWPQSKKPQDVTVFDEADSCGRYAGDDGNKYVKVKNNYYKIEPIKWLVLKEKDGAALLLCDKIIAAVPFAKRKNNYAKSDIRLWLNGEFLSRAFSDEERERIFFTEVDNSLQSTLDDQNECVCANTVDKIFLLSREEAFKKCNLTKIGRQRAVTGYAEATGALVSSKNGNGWWWLRSPWADGGDSAYGVTDDGRFICNVVDTDIDGVVPALIARLPQSRI